MIFDACGSWWQTTSKWLPIIWNFMVDMVPLPVSSILKQLFQLLANTRGFAIPGSVVIRRNRHFFSVKFTDANQRNGEIPQGFFFEEILNFPSNISPETKNPGLRQTNQKKPTLTEPGTLKLRSRASENGWLEGWIRLPYRTRLFPGSFWVVACSLYVKHHPPPPHQSPILMKLLQQGLWDAFDQFDFLFLNTWLTRGVPLSNQCTPENKRLEITNSGVRNVSFRGCRVFWEICKRKNLIFIQIFMVGHESLSGNHYTWW